MPRDRPAKSPAGESVSVGALEKERGRRAMTGGSARSVGARATRLREQAGARGELGRGVGCWRGREREGGGPVRFGFGLSAGKRLLGWFLGFGWV